MSHQAQDQNQISDASSSSPIDSQSTFSNHVSIDTATLENDLIPSPPASEIASSRSNETQDASSPNYANLDGSSRMYRFPSDLPPRFGDSSSDRDPNDRVVTIRDLRSKTCWICSDEDEEPLPAQHPSPSTPSSSPAVRSKRFVHPCNCTLVAHESCLLRWIEQSKRDHPLQDHVTCPQCKAPYIIINNKTTLLKAFEFFDKLITHVEPFGAIALFGGSVLVACTTYGCMAIRMFLGKDAARRALASPWPWHYWVDIPLIPFALIASRLNVFESAMTWVPTLVAFPLVSIPMAGASAAHERLFNSYLESSLVTARAYPPGPALTALLIPWIRVFYLALKRKVYRAVLHPFYGTRRNDESQITGRGRNRRRVVIVGEPDSYLVDGGTADELDPDDFGATVQFERNVDGGQEPTQTVYVTHHSLARLCLGALTLPFMANLMGKVLARMARFSPFLAKFLGMTNVSPASSSVLSSFYTTKATPTARESSETTPSPTASLLLVKRGKDEAWKQRLSWFGYSNGFDDLDPVWFRNAVGAGVYILVKDAGSLLYRYLRLSQRNRTSIKDLPFPKGLVGGLDLKQ
uniref:Uncharacterized conserved protein n=1 Tax=Melanopsichium pennsylvanicum 4 TaxID=1398559 RepID=A0A077RAY5_9BASI|nr:uncharacterized conserved protein [Melanopsichium pennsylvanicum 4]